MRHHHTCSRFIEIYTDVSVPLMQKFSYFFSISSTYIHDFDTACETCKIQTDGQLHKDAVAHLKCNLVSAVGKMCAVSIDWPNENEYS